MTDSEILALLYSARRTPTFDTWYEVLTYSLSGELDDSIERLGGIDSFIDATVVNSPSPAATKIRLDAALEAYVNAWQPGIPALSESTAKILRLIAARTPPSGFVKVLSQLVGSRSFPLSGDPDSESVQHINELALTALRNYFPVPPSDRGAFPAYETYTKLLWDSLQKDDWRGHACTRLVELGQLKVDDRWGRELLSHWPEEVIPALLAWLLYTKYPERNLLLSQIYVQIRHTPKSLQLFRDSVIDNGCGLVEETNATRIALRSNEEIKLWVDDLESLEVQQKAKREWAEEASYARREVEAILEEAS